MGMIIAVDGPAASGKGTIARALAAHYGVPHLDTGLLYRAVGLTLCRAGGDPASEQDACAATLFPDSLLADPELRTEETGALASRVSAHPAVRASLMERQRSFAHQSGGAVLDGRDIGTVICPDAHVKLFVTASTQERSKRRHLELTGKGIETTYEAVLADMIERDKRDSERAAAPLKPAADAHILDTSTMSEGEVMERALSIIRGHIVEEAAKG